MKNYSVNNSILNYNLFSILFIVAIPFIFYIPKASTVTILVFIGVFLTILFFVIKLFLRLAFEINFMENEIIIDYYNQNRKVTYKYSDLLSVTHNLPSKGISTNKFVFSNGQSTKTYRTPLIESGENFVTFIKYLKSKNNNFKTYINPKGSVLHLRLRQELLGTEY